MKKYTENQLIDDLFARKLNKMSLPPNPDGFERLQARISKPETRVVFWRNPVMQRYMAAAACLVIVCLFGWLYWPSDTKTALGESQIASKTLPVRPQRPAEKQLNQLADTSVPNAVIPALSNQVISKEQLAKIKVTPEKYTNNNQSIAHLNEIHQTLHKRGASARNEPVLAQTEPDAREINPETTTSTPKDVTPIGQSTSEQVAISEDKTNKPISTAERVLVVTIDEPASLVAARQAAKAAVDEKSVVSATSKPEKEAKTGGLWQQVKRIKQGELFVRSDNVGNDERGLLSRAYDGLKHNFDKDKSVKQ